MLPADLRRRAVQVALMRRQRHGRAAAAPAAGSDAVRASSGAVASASGSPSSTSAPAARPSSRWFGAGGSTGREEMVVIALGGNVGDVPAAMASALPALAAATGFTLIRGSRLYASPPAYVTDQPPFLNAAVAGTVRSTPAALLRAIKTIEAAAGRGRGGASPPSIRYGPRPLDLDIIFYGARTGEFPGEGGPLPVDSGGGGGAAWSLTLPHPRWEERPFVLAPLADLFSWDEAAAGVVAGDASASLLAAHRAWYAAGGEAQFGGVVGGGVGVGGGRWAGSPSTPAATSPPAALRPVLALPHGAGTWQVQARGPRTGPVIMAILNATPDSFSDGGLLGGGGPGAAVAAARAAVSAGATALDVGGQSTRPGAALISEAEEASRVLPVIQALAADPALDGVPLSVDTFYAGVADAAVAAGAHVVNDVSGGRADAAMLATIARLGVPYIVMHSRGRPDDMAAVDDSDYGADGGVVPGVGAGLASARAAATRAGVPPWQLILDPGLGFSKASAASLELLGRLPTLRAAIGGDGRVSPLLVGPSRKGFLGDATGRASPAERDAATGAAVALASAGGADILRVHAPAACVDGARLGAAVAAAVGEAERVEGVRDEDVAAALWRTLASDE